MGTPLRRSQYVLFVSTLIALLAWPGQSAAAKKHDDDPAFRAALASLQLAAGAPDGAKIRQSRNSGLVTSIVMAPGRSLHAGSGEAGDVAVAFVSEHAPLFGLRGSGDVSVLSTGAADEAGIVRVRMQQIIDGIPVTGTQLSVSLKEGAVVRAFANTSADAATVNTNPQIPDGSALVTAREAVRKYRHTDAAALSKPRLEILDRSLLDERRIGPPRLAWFIEARGSELRESIWIDAVDGVVLLHFSQLMHAKNRSIYNANNTDTIPGTIMRVEGGPPTGDADADAAYTLSGTTYDYFFTQHGRDSWNGVGGPLISTVHYCPDECLQPYANAFWNGSQMVYGSGYSTADDVDAHELTHAVTETSAGLLYYMQSGALNESFSDIFGETVDLTDGTGVDTAEVRWLIGEEIPGGAIRDMMNPNTYDDPSKVSDETFFWCYLEDEGGVHINSGIPNHAYALMVDGGMFNGFTVTGLGLTKAAKIAYRTLTQYLGPASNFVDAYDATTAACGDLVGLYGITAADCQEVHDALDAVEMDAPWPCTAAPPVNLPMCSQGTPIIVSADGFETLTGGNWSTALLAGTPNHWIGGSGTPAIFWSDYATEGSYGLYGHDLDVEADSVVSMVNPVSIPAGARMQFQHAWQFEEAFDGGMLEYSVNGTTWNDALPLMTAGGLYNGTITVGIDRQAFTGASFGFTQTQLDLAALAGQSVRFRFRIYSDYSWGDKGWMIDDVRIYTCASGPPTNVVAAATAATSVQVTWTAVAGATSYQVFRKAAGGTYTQIGSPALPSFVDSTVSADKSYLYRVRAVIPTGTTGDSAPDIATTVVFTDEPLTVAVTKAKLVHLTEARTAVNAVRELAGLTAASFTDAAAAGLRIKAVHITEMRTALDQALSALTLPVTAYTDASLAGIRVKAAHVQELRNRMK